MKPKVSVIMPAYNAERYIGEAIESILNQSYKELELIIIDDCSSDSTLELVKKYKDNRIKLLKNNENRGIAYTTNYGIDISSGEYIALLDDDDIAYPERLEIQVNYLEKHPEIDILGGRTEIIDEESNHKYMLGIPRNNPKYIKAMLLFHNLDFSNGTAMIRRMFIEKNRIQYLDNCLGMQDYRFFIECSKYGNISSVDKLLLKHRSHSDNETKRRIKNQYEERALRYAEFQRYSLQKSGFNLEEKYLYIINKTLKESGGIYENLEELQLLRDSLCEILRQGKAMGIDYGKELEIVCKKELIQRMMNFELEKWIK